MDTETYSKYFTHFKRPSHRKSLHYLIKKDVSPFLTIITAIATRKRLAILDYQQKKNEEAITELEISLNQFESAKAKYFLNLTREEYLKVTGLD